MLCAGYMGALAACQEGYRMVITSLWLQGARGITFWAVAGAVSAGCLHTHRADLPPTPETAEELLPPAGSF